MTSPEDDLAGLNRRIAAAVDAVRHCLPIVAAFAKQWDALVREDPGFAHLLWPIAAEVLTATHALNVRRALVAAAAPSPKTPEECSLHIEHLENFANLARAVTPLLETVREHREVMAIQRTECN